MRQSFYENKFKSMVNIPMESIADHQKEMLETLEESRVDPASGYVCTTEGRRQFLFGPNYTGMLGQWMELILSSRNKKDGIFISYGKMTDFSPKPWANNTIRLTVKPHLDDYSARRIIRKIKETDESRAVILSGSLLADLIIWMRHNEVVDFHRDLVFTTMDKFPPSLIPELKSYFDDWCDFMRVWDGGLSFFRCEHGTYHTMDHLSIIKTTTQNICLSTDLINTSEKFINHPTGDIVSRSETPQMCQCGMWHFNFKHLGSSNEFIIDHGGYRIQFSSLDQYPCGYQILQEKQNQIMALSSYEWTEERKLDIMRIADEKGLSIRFGNGYFRKGHSKPAVASTLIVKKQLLYIHIDSIIDEKKFHALAV